MITIKSKIMYRQIYIDTIIFSGEKAPMGYRECYFIYIQNSDNNILEINISYKIAGVGIAAIEFALPEECIPITEMLDFCASIEATIELPLKIKFKPSNIKKLSFRVIYK